MVRRLTPMPPSTVTRGPSIFRLLVMLPTFPKIVPLPVSVRVRFVFWLVTAMEMLQ